MQLFSGRSKQNQKAIKYFIAQSAAAQVRAGNGGMGHAGLEPATVGL
jgi:hypothetical protein